MPLTLTFLNLCTEIPISLSVGLAGIVNLLKAFSIAAKTGKITVKKGLKKGTYKLKIKVNAAGNSAYKAARKTITVTIKGK